MNEWILLYHQVKLITLIISLNFISMLFYINWLNHASKYNWNNNYIKPAMGELILYFNFVDTLPLKYYNVFWYWLGFNWWSRIECFLSTYCKFLTLWYLYLRYSTTNFAWLLLVELIVMWKYLCFAKTSWFYMPNIKAWHLMWKDFQIYFRLCYIFLYWLNY